MDIINDDNKNKITKEGSDIMPPAAAVEKEREQYYIEMETYLAELKNLELQQAVKVAKKNLIDAGIINKSGKLTKRYANSRRNRDNTQ